MLDHPILFSTEMVRAILEGRKTQTRRIIKESYNGCWTNGGPHPCPNDPVVMYPGEFIKSPFPDLPDFVVDGDKVRAAFFCSTMDRTAYCRFGKPGDWLWVRESFGELYDYCDHPELPGCPTEKWSLGKRYKADGYLHSRQDGLWSGWKPSIHMPKDISRIWLEVEEIKVEAIQDISEEDAKSEGVYMQPFDDPIEPADFSYCPNCGGQFVHGAFGENYGVTEVDCTTCDTHKKRFKILWNKINGEDSWKENPWVWVVKFKVLSTTGKPKLEAIESVSL